MTHREFKNKDQERILKKFWVVDNQTENPLSHCNHELTKGKQAGVTVTAKLALGRRLENFGSP